MHSLASREARLAPRDVPAPPPGSRRLPSVRAALQLGFFACTLAACAPADLHALARDDDRTYGTSLFTWLVDHEPSAVVTWRVPAETVRALLPGSRIDPAGATKVCAQAGRAHALLFLVRMGTTAQADRSDAEDCGFALARDEGGIIVAPR